MRHFEVKEENTFEIKDGIVCHISPASSQYSYICEWTKEGEDYAPTVFDWKILLEKCLDEKWDVLHNMEGFAEAAYDGACFGYVSPTVLRSVSMAVLDFRRECYIAAELQHIINVDKEADDVKAYCEMVEKYAAARRGLDIWMEGFANRK